MRHAVLMAGGKGTRFWPLSRKTKPKQFLKIAGAETLLDRTIARLEGLIPLAERWLVGNFAHQSHLQGYTDRIPARQMLLEPMGKNTAASIGWAAIEILKVDPAATLIILAADHDIAETDLFQNDLLSAIKIAEAEPCLVTIGLPPKFAHTGYGYIKTEEDGLQVCAFQEKPDLATAAAYVAAGNYYWNSGMFVCQAQVILALFQQFLPSHYAILQKISQLDQAAPNYLEQLSQLFQTFEAVSLDYGILEKAIPHIKMLCGHFSWSDIGNWTALEELLPKDSAGNASSSHLHTLNSHHNIICAGQKIVTLIDVQDLIVIDTPDALLILPKTSDQKIRQLCADLPDELQ